MAVFFPSHMEHEENSLLVDQNTSSLQESASPNRLFTVQTPGQGYPKPSFSTSPNDDSEQELLLRPNYGTWPYSLLSMSVKKTAMVLFLFLALLPTATKSAKDFLYTKNKCFTRPYGTGSNVDTRTVEFLCVIDVYSNYIVSYECLKDEIAAMVSEKGVAQLNNDSFSGQYSMNTLDSVYVIFETTKRYGNTYVENVITNVIDRISNLCKASTDRTTPSPVDKSEEKDVVPAILWSVFGSALVYAAISVGVVMLYRKMRAAKRTKGNEEIVNPYTEISPDVEAIAEGNSQRTEEDNQGLGSQMNKNVKFVESAVVYVNEVQEWDDIYV